MYDRVQDLHLPYGPASRRLAGMEKGGSGGGLHLQLRCEAPSSRTHNFQMSRRIYQSAHSVIADTSVQHWVPPC